MKSPAVIDFETYYDKEYTLRKLTTEQYVRDPRFKAHGVGVYIDGEYRWITHDIQQELAALDLHERPVLMHHAQFDGFILSHHYNIEPGFILDTLSMGRALGFPRLDLNTLAQVYGLGQKMAERLEQTEGVRDLDPQTLASLGEYCEQDVLLTNLLFATMRQEFPTSELRIINSVVKMFTSPSLKIDSDVVRVTADSEEVKTQRLLAMCAVSQGDLMSNNRFAEILREHGVEPPTKVSLTTGRETLAMAKSDKEFTALLEHPNEIVRGLVEARLGVKSTIIRTRAESMRGIAARGPWPVYLRYSGARQTHRLSGADKVNPQNLNRGSLLRKAVHAPEGHVVAACDSSNIELRVNMTLAQQWDVIEALRAGADLYCDLASIRYGRTITKKDKAERQYGKICHLALGYGMGAEKFMETARLNGLTVTMDEAIEAVALYRRMFGAVPDFWSRAKEAIPRMRGVTPSPVDPGGLIVTGHQKLIKPSGMPLLYQNLRQQQKEDRSGFEWVYDGFDEETGRPKVRRVYGGKLVENIVQSVARDIVCEQMLVIESLLARRREADTTGKKVYRVAMQVHDEVVCVLPKDEAAELIEEMEVIMATAPMWFPDVPLAAEGDWSFRYGDCK